MNLRIEVLESELELNEARERWNELAGPLPFFQWEWLANWQKHCSAGATPYVVVVKDADDRWIGLAPFCVVDLASSGRTLQLMSSGVACGDYLSLICRPGYELIVFDWLADWLAESAAKTRKQGGFDTIILEGVEGNSEPITTLHQRMVEHGFTSFKSELEGCWEVELPATWESLNISFSKSHRRKTKKAVQRLAEAGTEVLSSREHGVDALWKRFVDLHQLRRESLGEPGCFADGEFHTFLQAATKDLADREFAELVVFEKDSVPFGSLLLLNDDRRMFMYQSGFDPQASKLEPGYQMLVWALQQAIDRGYDSMDFLRGDEPYKSRWKTVRKPLHKIKLVAPKWKAQVRHQIWLSGKALKNMFVKPAPVVDS